MNFNLHEDISREMQEDVVSEKNLGVTFACICFIVGGIGFYLNFTWGITLIVLGAAFLFLAFFFTLPLRPLNALWSQIGKLLFLVVNPLVMGAIFFLTIYPIGLIMRMLGKDILNLKRNPLVDSYWLKRPEDISAKNNMKNQF